MDYIRNKREVAVMDGEPRTHSFDLGAIGRGTLLGLGLLLTAGLVQGMVGYGSPFTVQTENILRLVWQTLASLAAGFWSARRAAGAGWLHGGLAGLFVMLGAAFTMGIASALPAILVLAKMAGVGAGGGALAGVLGINLRRR
jgi:putative membrane protein (TIGR04086 family)